MGKLIAVWGSPGSGKTTFSVKLAEALNSRSKKSAGHKTLVVFTDLTSPVVPVVFPNKKSEDIYSLGSVLVKTDLSPNLGSKRYYIQSAFSMHAEEKVEQEIQSLKRIDDSFKKIIIVKDDIKVRRDDNGFVTMGIFDFLLNENSLEY